MYKCKIFDKMNRNASYQLQIGIALYVIIILDLKQLISCYILVMFKKNINHFMTFEGEEGG